MYAGHGRHPRGGVRLVRLRDDWPEIVPIALPSDAHAACRCRIVARRSIVGR